MKSSTALKKARKLIVSYQEVFVCIALEEVGAEKTKVYKRLDNLFPDDKTADEWLLQNSIDYCDFRARLPIPHWYSQQYEEAMRHYRLAWIDWLIPQYKAKGD